MADNLNMQDELCEISIVNPETVARLQPVVRQTRGVSELYKALADETRSRILYALAAEELCVCDLSAIVESTPSNISHHLRLLRAAHLVSTRKEGKMVYYALDDDHVRQLLALGLEHLEHTR
jgi:DNA-binding transcriptional ArsR family regulator